MESITHVLRPLAAQQAKRPFEPSQNGLPPEVLNQDSPTSSEAFRQRLRELIREIGTEAELERRAGLPLGLVSHYTRTHRPSDPSRSNVVKLALAGGVSIAWLAAGIGPKRSAM